MYIHIYMALAPVLRTFYTSPVTPTHARAPAL